MKLKSIKIENYKSFAEENNTLILEDLNTIIGKNESGKSNLIECLSGISLSGISDKSFFQKFNKNTGKHPIISVILIPTKEEEKKYKIVGETKITLNDQYDIDIEGGFSDLIKNNKIFQENKKSLNELNKNVVDLFYNQDDRKKFNNIIEMINESENKMFFNYNYVKNITEKIYNNSNYTEFSECLKKCISYLEEIQELLPYFIEIKDYSLKSKYTKSYLEDSSKSKEMLKHLLNCMDMKLDDLMEYWDISNGGDKLNFSEEFNEKLEKIIAEFNKFYTQEKVEMKAIFENDSLNFAIKTTKKYMDFEERSNGLKWYLNMFIQIMSETNSTDIENYIILIDEPGVYLHINAQKEVLKLFEDFATKNNQIIYTTHSPFMIYEDKLYRSRLIIKDDKGNSNIGNKYYSLPHKMGSKTETLTPILTAMGISNYNILSLDNKKCSIITEGISDYNYIKGYLQIKKNNNIYNIIPSVSVDNINNIASIFIGWGCNFKVILDQDDSGRKQYKLLKNKLAIDSSNIVFIDGETLPIEKKKFTIEDVFSDSDKNKIGINNEDYNNEKAFYSLGALKEIENGEFEYDKETIERFDKIFQLFEK
jgi:hypothetical protein